MGIQIGQACDFYCILRICFLVGNFFNLEILVYNMSGKTGRKNSLKFQTPAMKKWQRNYLKQENEEVANSRGEVVTGFLIPAFATFCFFMVAGALTAGESWGIVPAFAMTMIFWSIISLIFILYYNSKGNENRNKGATSSFIASLALIVITIVFGGILQS